MSAAVQASKHTHSIPLLQAHARSMLVTLNLDSSIALLTLAAMAA